jgi:DNA helicase-2/ATP-dependent DNA helicase PcrA
LRVALNPEQQAAVWHGDGPLLVLAGAGSGKTRVLTTRIARLIEEGLPPSRILAVTFTNKAAEVMRHRISSLVGHQPAGIWAGTFHSICARMLRIEAEHTDRSSAFTIYDESDSERAIKRAMEDADADPRRWSARGIRARISDAKNAMVSPAEYAAAAFDPLSRVTGEVYPAYERLLARCNAYDFDDLLLYAVRLLEDRPEVREHYGGRFAHVLVDEYQDTNHAQYRLVRALASVHGNVCVVGDDDQSIYGWRGADLRNILNFERDFPGTAVVHLEQNYRSTGAILHVANAVIARNRARKEKKLRTERPQGESVVVAALRDERAEAAWTVRKIEQLRARHALGEIGILYRTNAQSRAYEDALRGADMPYRVVGGIRFYERREVKDVLAYLQLLVNPSDDGAFLRAVGWPRRGVGAVTLERLAAARAAAGGSLLDAAARAAELEGLPVGPARALVSFARDAAALRDLVSVASAADLAEECLRTFGLRAALEAEEDGEERLANVDELVAGMAAFAAEGAGIQAETAGSELERFLQHVSLLSDVDQYDQEEGAVSLMTLHNAKGMEFPVVFIGGVEEGLLPLGRSAETMEALEEERRLFYVGLTRAMDRLHVTHVSRRFRAGSAMPCFPSSFLDDLPEEAIDRRLSAVGGWRSGRWPRPVDSSRPGRGGRSDGFAARSAATRSSFTWRRDPAEVPESGPVYDYSESQEPLELLTGARIVHPRFGAGTVLSVVGDGRAAKARIEFDLEGPKIIMVAHAGLRPAP